MHRENEPSSTTVERINVLPDKNMSFLFKYRGNKYKF